MVGLLWGATEAGAQSPGRWKALTSVVFRNYGHDQGMPHPVATALAQDHDGFIWIGTQGGLARWDGYRFKSYKADASVSGSLPDDWIQTLHVDPAGRLWIGTTAGQLALYDSARDRFALIPLGLEAGRIHIGAILDDGVGGLWIGTDDGLRHLTPQTGAVGVLRSGMPGAAGLPAGRIQAALRDRTGTLWIGTPTGLTKRADKTRDFLAVSLGGQTLGVSALYLDMDGRVWIGTVRDGLFVIDRPGAKPRPIGADAHLPPSSVSAICAAGPHEIWVSLRDSGILSVDTRSGVATRILHDRTLPNSLAHDDIWTLLRDDAGSLWAGGTGGLSYHPHDPGLISTVFGQQERSGSLSSSDVLSILLTQDGHVWLGYIAGGVDVIDPVRGRIAALRPDSTYPARSLPREAMFAMAQGAGGRVYLGTRRGLYRSDLSARTAALVAVKGRDPHLAINALAYDAGTLWIGGEYDGLWAIAPGKGAGSPDRIAFGATDAAKLSNPEVTVIQRGSGQDLWVGTRNGLNRVNLTSHAVERILADPADPQGLPGRFVSSLQIDRKGRLWVGTFGGGLALATGRDADGRMRFRRFGLPDGLPHLNVDSLSMDGEGMLWAGTDDGLARVDPNTLSIRAVGPAEGAALRDYFVGARGATIAGEALFGAKDGLAVVRPGPLPPWRFRPRMVITDLRVGGMAVPIASGAHDGTATPVLLTPTTNSLAVEFAALDFTFPDHNRYAYRLEGFDRRWTETDSTRRLASYTNLPPGDYVLRLRGSNRAGAWTAPSLALVIRVLPAWYQRLWFKFALLALVRICLSSYSSGGERPICDVGRNPWNG